MVHALEEAWRVLKPDGPLIDLRPAMVHRTVGVAGAEGFRRVGVMHEDWTDDVAANRAVAGVVRRGLFRRARRERFDCARVMDTLERFRDWIAYPVSLGKLPPHDRLVERVEAVLEQMRGRTSIVVNGPLDLQVLIKRDSTGRR